jgi:hypothetical protein
MLNLTHKFLLQDEGYNCDEIKTIETNISDLEAIVRRFISERNAENDALICFAINPIDIVYCLNTKNMSNRKGLKYVLKSVKSDGSSSKNIYVNQISLINEIRKLKDQASELARGNTSLLIYDNVRDRNNTDKFDIGKSVNKEKNSLKNKSDSNSSKIENESSSAKEKKKEPSTGKKTKSQNKKNSKKNQNNNEIVLGENENDDFLKDE